jgi:Uma2 family endonuclease
MASSSQEAPMSEQREWYGVAEYLAGEETTRPQELVWGRVRDAPAPSPAHQTAVLDFAVAWRQYVRERHLGLVIVSAMDCVLDRERALVVQPDVLFVSTTRTGIVTDRVWGAPDLVLEVLSPKPRLGTLNERLDWFATYGTSECWLYHQLARELEVVSFDNGAIGARRRFGFHDRIVSNVFAAFDQSCASIISMTLY